MKNLIEPIRVLTEQQAIVSGVSKDKLTPDQRKKVLDYEKQFYNENIKKEIKDSLNPETP